MARLEIGQIIAVIKEKLPEAVVEEVLDGVDPFVVVKAEQWGETAQLCRDDSRLGFDLLSCISGVDYPEREEGPEIEVIYHLDSTVNHHGLTIKGSCPAAIRESSRSRRSGGRRTGMRERPTISSE